MEKIIDFRFCQSEAKKSRIQINNVEERMPITSRTEAVYARHGTAQHTTKYFQFQPCSSTGEFHALHCWAQIVTEIRMIWMKKTQHCSRHTEWPVLRGVCLPHNTHSMNWSSVWNEAHFDYERENQNCKQHSTRDHLLYICFLFRLLVHTSFILHLNKLTITWLFSIFQHYYCYSL